MNSEKHWEQPKERYEGSGIILLQDVALSIAASLLSVLMVRWISEPIPSYTTLVLNWLGCSLAGSLLAFLFSGSHKVVRRWATVQSSARLIEAVAIKEAVLVLVLILGLVRFPSMALDAVAILTDTMLTGILLIYIRFAARMFSHSEVKKVKQAAARMNALVMGTDAEAVQLARELSKEYNIVGFLTDNPSMAGRVIADTIVYHCASDEEREALEWRLGGVDCIFFPKNRGKKTPGQSQGNRAEKDKTIIRDGMSRAGQAFKRSFDVLLSGILLILFSPVAALCALAIKLEDGEPILYRQERIGKDGRPFFILKFRSMRTDAEADGARLYAGDDDPRLTRVGAFLRQHHLDELPQLWNVFKGDMSFIGYRPERQCYIDKIMAQNPRYRYLYQIRPGVTSYATLYNGYTDTLEKMLTRLDLDLYYLRNHSLLFDARVLGLTFLGIVSGKKF